MSSLPENQRDVVGPPSDVQVTVFRFVDDRALHRRFGRYLNRILPRLHAVTAVALPVALVGVLLAAALGVGGHAGSAAAAAGVRDAGPSGVAAAFGYPSGCMKVRISALDPTFARADFTRIRSCGLDSGFPSALFHRFDGEWHPVLYTVTYPCPMPSIPAAVRRQLSVCPG